MKIIKVFQILFVVSLAILTVPKIVFAEQCGGSNGSCGAGWTCTGYIAGPPETPGTCSQQGCWYNVCEYPNICAGDYCYPPGGTCFLPGTKVETVEGSKNIETMSVGDRVKSFDGDDKVVKRVCRMS